MPKPDNTMLTTSECRLLRSAFPENAVARQMYALELPDGTKVLAWKNVLHRSTELYMCEIRQSRFMPGQFDAHLSMINKSCQYKRIGLATPTTQQMDAWEQLCATS